MQTLVVLPTYQEAANIENTLRAIHSSLPTAEMLVVDDGSPDGTATIAEKVGADVGGVHVLRRSQKMGLGSAYRDGFEWGAERGFEILVEMDSDGQHDPASLPELVDAIERWADLSIGSRYVPGGEIPKWSLHRRVLSRWGNVYASVMLGLGIRDATSGFRAYRTSILEKIDMKAVRADGYGFQIEMAWRVRQAGGRIVEVPIRFRERELGESKMSSQIVLEALTLVTRWGVKARIDQWRHRR